MAKPQPQFSEQGPIASASTGRNRRRFTLVEAARTLPLVSRIVKDIVEVHGICSHLQASIESAPRRSSKTEELEAQLEVKLQRLHDLVGEINQVGCELKDCAMGLIDFPARHQGRDIYLCWKLGEDRINYWHELHSGFAGRQPVSVLEEKV
jgi:hypothetical protein